MVHRRVSETLTNTQTQMQDAILDMTKPNNWLLQPNAVAELRDFAHGMSAENLNPDFAREYGAVRDALDRLHACHSRERAGWPTTAEVPATPQGE